MDLLDIATIGIAIYGAIISTVLGIREFNKNKRKIKIIFEHVVWEERFQVTVVNVGYRPITITGIAMSVLNESGKFYEQIMPGDLLENFPFPETLDDGKSMVIRLRICNATLMPDSIEVDIQNNPKITIFDTEGNEYTKYETQEINMKWDAIQKEKKNNELG